MFSSLFRQARIASLLSSTRFSPKILGLHPVLVKKNGRCDLSIQLSRDTLPPMSVAEVKFRVSRESNFRFPGLEIASLGLQRRFEEYPYPVDLILWLALHPMSRLYCPLKAF